MNNNLKIQMTGDKDIQTVLLGNSFHVLEDLTRSQYSTKSFEDFFKYLAGLDNANKIFVYFNPATLLLVAFENEVKRHSAAIAKCQLDQHPFISILKKVNPAKMAIDEFEQFLSSAKPYLGNSTMELMDVIANLSIQKIISVERQRDQSGNFAYSVKSKSGGKDDYEFQKEIEFVFSPIFQFKEITESFKFNLYFGWKSTTENPDIELTFEFLNPEFSMLVDEKIRQILTDAVAGKWDEYRLFPGTFTVIEETDQWKYLDNGPLER